MSGRKSGSVTVSASVAKRLRKSTTLEGMTEFITWMGGGKSGHTVCRPLNIDPDDLESGHSYRSVTPTYLYFMIE
jgi:hypothetical protein